MEMDSMTTMTKVRPPVKTELVSSEVFRVLTYTTLRLVTRTGVHERTEWYHVRRLDCPDVAFELKKFSDSPGTDAGEDTYHINLDDPTCGCSCKGWTRWGYCKHHHSLTQLAERGSL
jgi:hypothetical protein